jgi:hypothetical protein
MYIHQNLVLWFQMNRCMETTRELQIHKFGISLFFGLHCIWHSAYHICNVWCSKKNATHAVFQRCNSSSVITQAAVFCFLPLSDGTVNTDFVQLPWCTFCKRKWLTKVEHIPTSQILIQEGKELKSTVMGLVCRWDVVRPSIMIP